LSIKAAVYPLEVTVRCDLAQNFANFELIFCAARARGVIRKNWSQ